MVAVPTDIDDSLRAQSVSSHAPAPLTISVITASLNAAATLEGAIASVRAQSGVRVEHILIDGASVDATPKIIARCRDHLACVVSEPDAGIYDALNKGITRATGDVVGLLHSDDLYAGPNVLASVAQAFEDPTVDGVYGDLQYVSFQDPDRVVRHWRAGVFQPTLLKRGWMLPHPTLYLRRAVYERLGLYNLQYRIASDYEYILRLMSDPSIRLRYIPEVLVRMRVGGTSNRTLKNIARKSREDLAILRALHVGGVRTLLWKNLGKLPQLLVRRVQGITTRPKVPVEPAAAAAPVEEQGHRS